jgi:hypothetical protein
MKMDEQLLCTLSDLPVPALPTMLSRRTLARARAHFSATSAAPPRIERLTEALSSRLVPLALSSADLVFLIDSLGKMLRAFGR